jgi:type I restriction enzyme S subunit
MKAYPFYKESGIEAIGNIPGHWNISSLKRLLKENLMYGANESAELDDKELPRYIRITDFDEKGNLRDNTFRSLPYEVAKDYFLSEGDILFARSGATVGKTFQFKDYDGQACFAGYLIKASPDRNQILSDFLYLFTKSNSYDFWKNSIFIQATIQNIGANKYQYLQVPVPPLQEQQAIADFLTCKTAQIDTLIEKKQRQIDLLQEQRTALINHAVTKGLKPNVSVKESNTEFYPPIPEHWVMTKLGYLCNQIADGPHYSPEYVDEGILFISARNVKVDRWQFDDAKYITEAEYQKISERVKPEKGDVLYTKGGTTGVARAVDFDEPFQVWVHIIVLKLKREKVDPFFLAYVLNSVGCYDQSQLFTRGATNNDLGVTRVGNIILGLPPLDEQVEIVHFLRDQTQKIDLESKSIEKMIDLIKEYRTALISEAVTGKIDVREWKTVHE